MEYLARRGDTGETADPGCGMSNGAEVGQASRPGVPPASRLLCRAFNPRWKAPIQGRDALDGRRDACPTSH